MVVRFGWQINYLSSTARGLPKIWQRPFWCWDLQVLIHIWTKGEVGVPWNRCKPCSKIFLLTVPRRYFFCGSLVLFMACVCHTFAAAHCCLVVSWREKANILALSCLWCLLWFCYFRIWHPGTGVVLDIIDSWSLLSFLLYTYGLCVENKFQLLAAVVKISPVYVTILDYDYHACGCSVL